MASDLSGIECARKAYGVTRQLAGKIGPLLALLNIEEKYSDFLFAGVAFGLGFGNQTLVSGLSLGNTATTRNGQSVKWTNYQYDLRISMGTVSQVTYIRFMIVQDRVPNGAAFATGDLFQAAVSGTDFTTSLYNVGNERRFIIYSDQMVSMNSANSLTHMFQGRLLVNAHTEYNTGNAGTIADIQTGSFYFLFLSNQSVNTPTITGAIRVRFVDN